MTRSHWTCLKPGRISVSLGKVERRDDLLLFQPLIDAELIADVAALENEELLIEFFLQFPLPLEGEVGRADDENPLGKPAQLKFADEEPSHDRLACPGIVGQQEADAGQLQKIVVDGLELVRQRIDAGDREAEVGVKFPGNAERIGLKAQTKKASVALVGKTGIENGKRIKVAER